MTKKIRNEALWDGFALAPNFEAMMMEPDTSPRTVSLPWTFRYQAILYGSFPETLSLYGCIGYFMFMYFIMCIR
ncbi:DEAD-box ATP-dependent RNA helicase 10 [Iris pallida]|uniref:DEAD-box ATP-dependent RNA helicase 10 n=1 Tax=Iris pallida TaxID=29817 RepID=A0AAX6FHF9_IRIPA|nr:DEAD-box ATP-dependent RNA helicase 10 [Iris pallida]